MDIQTLLKKKKLTGEEVGKALIVNLVYDFTDRPLIMTQEQLNRMEARIKNIEERELYAKYFNLFKMLVLGYRDGQSFSSKFYHAYYELFAYLNHMHTAKTVRDTYNPPYIMTKREYERRQASLSSQDFKKEYPNGVAIIVDEYITSKNTDKEGNFINKAPEITSCIPQPAHSKLFFPSISENMNNTITNLQPIIKFIIALNALFEEMADIYNIKEITLFQATLDIGLLKECTKQLNELIRDAGKQGEIEPISWPKIKLRRGDKNKIKNILNELNGKRETHEAIFEAALGQLFLYVGRP